MATQPTTTTTAHRPGGITLIVVLAVIGAIFNILGGIWIILDHDDHRLLHQSSLTENGLLGTGIVAIVIGVIYLLVVLGARTWQPGRTPGLRHLRRAEPRRRPLRAGGAARRAAVVGCVPVGHRDHRPLPALRQRARPRVLPRHLTPWRSVPRGVSPVRSRSSTGCRTTGAGTCAATSSRGSRARPSSCRSPWPTRRSRASRPSSASTRRWCRCSCTRSWGRHPS